MKKTVLMAMVSVMATSAWSAQTPNLPPQWDCEAQNTEGGSVYIQGHELILDVAWDCWPGGGICTIKEPVTLSKDAQGNLIYRGLHSWLQVLTSRPAVNGAYPAEVAGRDFQDDKDMGKGLPIHEGLKCSPAKR